MPENENRLTRIGVFYDGNYFLHVSNYYLYHHERRARISITGLHSFIRDQVAREEGSNSRYCQIVDAHYFRGRLRAMEAQERALLLKERLFDDVLVREGVVTHYLPLSPQGEKGIDVWFALEAFELAIYKRFDVSVLVACDSDYVPLARKLNTIGTRVMVLGWDFKFIDNNGIERETRTAQALLDEVTYPILMNTIIDDRARKNDSLINNMFFVPRREMVEAPIAEVSIEREGAEIVCRGTIQNILDGFGFITPEGGGENLFFYYGDVINTDFNFLQKGNRVEYALGNNEKGVCAKQVRLIKSP